MKMEYQLLNNNTGVILTRQPEILRGNSMIEVRFSGADAGSAAVFTGENGVDLYRILNDDGMCAVPVSRLRGSVVVSVVILDSTIPIKRWVCEQIKVTWKGQTCLVAPDDLNLPKVIADLRIENDELRKLQTEQAREISALKKRLDEIMDGYDLT